MSNRRRAQLRESDGAAARSRKEVLIAALTTLGVVAVTAILVWVLRIQPPSTPATTPIPAPPITAPADAAPVESSTSLPADDSSTTVPVASPSTAVPVAPSTTVAPSSPSKP